MKKYLITAMLLSFSLNIMANPQSTNETNQPKKSVFDDKLKEVHCDKMYRYIPKNKLRSEDDECFVSHTKIYTGYMPKNMGLIFHNKSYQPLYIYEKDKNGILGIDSYIHPLQGTTWNVPKDLFRWTTVEEGGVERKVTTDGQRFVREYPPFGSKVVMIANDGKGVTFVKSGANTNPDEPALMVEVILRHYSIQNGKLVGPKKTRDFNFYYAAWCGDGNVDTDYGEKYDHGTKNGQAGFASTDCKSLVPKN